MSIQERGPISVGNYNLCTSQLLGKGATGTVYKGYHTVTMDPVAIKVIDLSTIRDDATRSLLQNQKSALEIINHPNVVRLIEIIQENGHCFIITELCQGVTLNELLSKRNTLSQEESITIFRKILAGSLSITQNCIIHRDLKPANIIVSSGLEPKIIDFGFCQVIRGKSVIRAFNVGSPSYMSPQAYLRTLYSQKSDSWSLGMILYEMLHGKTLDQGQNIKQFYQLLKCNPNFIENNISPNLNTNVKQILQKSLKSNAEQRMSISGMKYLTDVYNLKRNNQSRVSTNACSNLNVSSHYNGTSSNFYSSNNHSSTISMAQTLHNISNQTINCPPKNMVSFADFSKPPPNHKFQHRLSKTSQISISNSSNKQISPKITQNMQFLANKCYQPQIEAAYQSLSSKQIMQRRPKGPPMYRQVTVRYL